jgi:8-oxo-dGTP pyrophosphatase MutT (NUDIX family)
MTASGNAPRNSMEVQDVFDPRPVGEEIERFHGLRWNVRSDSVELINGQTVVRDLVIHTGAVGIVAIDEQERVLLNRQYRHPVGAYLWEPPAGLLDVVDEDPLDCAKREFVEEAGLQATEWNVLFDFFNSPGGSTEAFRCYLARGLSQVPGGRPPGDAEEADLHPRWVPLDEAMALVRSGALHNPTAVTGICAAYAASQDGWEGLRPADSPWPLRDDLLRTDRVRLG